MTTPAVSPREAPSKTGEHDAPVTKPDPSMDEEEAPPASEAPLAAHDARKTEARKTEAGETEFPPYASFGQIAREESAENAALQAALRYCATAPTITDSQDRMRWSLYGCNKCGKPITKRGATRCSVCGPCSD